MRIILASGSPRRKELLSNMGLKYDIIVSDCEEVTEKTQPCDIVRELSMMKAEDVCKKVMSEIDEETYLIAADTLVFLGNEHLGKPGSPDEAKAMIRKLSGRSHEVITGVSVMKLVKKNDDSVDISSFSFEEETKVFVSELSEAEIEDYVLTGEPMDKAGAYAIQGKFAKYITKIDGDYSNVVGLPVAKLYKELKTRNWIWRV